MTNKYKLNHLKLLFSVSFIISFIETIPIKKALIKASNSPGMLTDMVSL